MNWKGFFWAPDLDPKEQLPVQTRTEINKKNLWLYNNVAPVSMIIDGLSLDEVDTGTWPKATTSNPAFNKAVTRDFHNINKDPRFFSASGMDNYYSAQLTVRRCIRLYGELFGQLLRAGDGIGIPTMHFVNPWQCTDAGKADKDSPRKDGIIRSRLDRAINYRFVTNAQKTQWEDVAAEDVLHFHDKFLPGQVRGTGILTPCTNSLFRYDDIDRAEANGLRLRSKMAYTLSRREGGSDDGPILPSTGKVEKIAQEDGSHLILQHLTSRDSDDVEVATIPAGYDMKVLESSRATSTIEFLKWILQTASYTSLYPAEYVFNLAGLGQGTLVRLVQKRVQRVKNTNRQFQLIPQFCDRWYNFWLWQRIKAGVYDKVKGRVPEDWFEHKTISPADDTVDLGREGKLFDDRVDSGKMSIEKYFGQDGEDAEDVDTENAAVLLRRLARIKEMKEANPDFADQITYERLYGSKKSNNPGSLDPQQPDPAEDPTKKKGQ